MNIVASKYNDEKHKSCQSFINYSRGWIKTSKRSQMKPKIPKRFKLVSYNILADGEKLALGSKHDYCPLNLRQWKLRFSKIKAELCSYNADIVCLQEILPTAFKSDFLPYFESSGFVGLYFRDTKSSKSVSIATATFIKTSSFKILDKKSVYFSSCVEPAVHTGKLKKKLLSLSEGVLMTLLQRRESENVVLVMNTHIHWDPSYPNIKAQQCAFACKAAKLFLKSACKPLNINEDVVPIVFAGDFNSIRDVQLAFLPSIQKQWYKHDDELNALGGAYQLLSTGYLHQSHPEHPDSFAKSLPPVITKTECKTSTGKKMKIKNARKFVGRLETKIDFNHVYEEIKIPFTTKVPDFQGPIDYIFFTSSKLHCIAYLEMPYSALDAVDTHKNVNFASENKPTPSEFPYIPNERWPSDHLAIGGIFEFRS